MRYFLIAYNRPKGVVEDVVAFDEQDDALRERFRREITRSGHDLELVVLGAEDQKDLERTHARYFKSVRQLVDG